ncbi:MAG: stage II sporulation protein R [Clostridia bacterium]|nr:stage II sporulation protein R [Clostridia bacterium]
MKFKHLLAIFLLLVIFLIFNIFSYSNKVFAGLQNNIFRLHILANSDSEADQTLKLAVRDSVIEYMKTINNTSFTKEETIQNVNSHLEDLQKIAEDKIHELGYDYAVSLEVGNFYFPTKYYGNISLPAGNYDALKINIGEAQGQNWWCSLFPPLCFIDISSGYLEDEDKEILETNLTEEEFALVSSSSPDVKLKFKIIELLNSK